MRSIGARFALLSTLLLVVQLACATSGAAKEPPKRDGLALVLPLEVRGDRRELADDEVERARGAFERALADTGLTLVRAPIDETRTALRGDEPDAELMEAATAAGATYVLSGFIAAREDRRLYGLRRLDGASQRTVARAAGEVADAAFLGALRAAIRTLFSPDAAASPKGPPTPGDLADRLHARSGFFTHCLVERLLARPELAGYAQLEVTVGEDGGPEPPRLLASTFADPELEACLLDAALQIEFPAGVGGETTLVVPIAWPLG